MVIESRVFLKSAAFDVLAENGSFVIQSARGEIG